MRHPIRVRLAAAVLRSPPPGPRAAAQSAPPAAMGASNAPFWTGMSDAAAFERAMDARLAHASRLLDGLVAVNGARTVANTLRPFDDVQLELDAVGSQAGLIQSVHPDETFRRRRSGSSQKVEHAHHAGVAEPRRLRRDSRRSTSAPPTPRRNTTCSGRCAISTSPAWTRTRRRASGSRRCATSSCRSARRSTATSARICGRSPRRSTADLEGLPRDFIARHKPDADGNITLTIDYPDSLPVFSYARNEDLRKRMFMEYSNRAYPKNIDVLDQMIAQRAELAAPDRLRQLGRLHHRRQDGRQRRRTRRPSSTASSPRRAPKAQREYETLLKRKQQDVPGATAVNAWEKLLLRGARAQGELRLRLTVGAAVPPVRSRQAGAVRRHRPAVRRHLQADHGRCRCGTPRSRPTRCCRTARSSAASISTCIRGRTSTTTRPNSASAPASRDGRFPKRRSSATCRAARPAIRA